MTRSITLLALAPTLFLAACGQLGGGSVAPTSPPPVVAAAAPVAAAPAVVEVIACKSEGGDVYIAGSGLYRTVGNDVFLVRGVSPDKDGLCVTKEGQFAEASCLVKDGPCGDSVRIEGVAGAKVPAHTPTKLVAANSVTPTAGGASSVSVSWLQERAISLGRQVSGLKGSDSKQTAALKALCSGSSDPACAPYVTAVATPLPAEATVESVAPAAAPAPAADEPAPPARHPFRLFGGGDDSDDE